MKSAVNIKGIAIPIEYINKSITPLDTVSVPPAYTNIDANTGPKHGVHPAANAIPIKVELNQLVTFLGVDTCLVLFKNPILNIPIIFKPKKVINNPLIRSEEHTSELQSRFDLVCRL